MNLSSLKRIVTPTVVGASLLIAPSVALAAPVVLTDAQLDAVTAGTNVHLFAGTVKRPAPGPGQPSQTIGVTIPASSTPGNAVNAPGSAFNPSGNAGTHYAGNAPQNSGNPKSVAQYDVAGFQQYQNHVVKPMGK
jgi:hypothetical protein